MASAVFRALSVCAPAVFFAPPAAIAQAVEPRLAADIPAQPIAKALAAFARQTGLQLIYVSEVVNNQRSHDVAAGLSADEALTQLLQGTGLRFDYLTARSIRILAAVAARSVTTVSIPKGEEIREVVVTANRREEDLQNVPITIQVLTGEKLAKLNATTFDDFLSNLPGVTAHGVGPGQNDINVRGLATTALGVQGSGFAGTFPNVAVYLDDQSAQLPSRNLDVYAADLERIEVLEGPQGTLFGAGAEAGVIRYITNKPKLNVTEAIVNAGYATTAHGAPSVNLDATFNIPLIADELAVRSVIYNERRGGYIRNLPATFARADSDLSIGYAYAGGNVPANSVVINNSNIAGHDINPVTYTGVRAEAVYRFDEDWSALLAQSYQNIEADGVFTEMATNALGEPQPDLSVQLFNPAHDKDKFENTALTLDGRIGALKLVYAGAYLVRNVAQVQDYTSYARGGLSIDYYQCANPGTNPTTAQCFTPSSTWHSIERNTHQSHELRVSTPDSWRIRAIGGLFYENYQIQNQVDWFYLTALPYFRPIEPATGYFAVNGQYSCACTPGAVFVPGTVTSNNPSIRLPGDGFFNDITRGYNQKAAYTSVDFEVIPKKLTLTAGTRYFRTDTSEVGSLVGAGGCQLINAPMIPSPCVTNKFVSFDVDAEGLRRKFSGFRSRVNLSSRVTEDALLYYTWSQGFRAGAFNRLAVAAAPGSPLRQGPNPWQAQARRHMSWAAPLDIAPDTLTNNELGWKTMWMDRRIKWNGAIYQEDWNNAQINLSGIGVFTLGANINGGNYRVRGVETSAGARITAGLSIEAAAAWNHSELVKQATLRWKDGTAIDFSALQDSNGNRLPNPGGALGSPLAGAPAFQGNIRARYEFAFNGYNAFAQIGAVYQSYSLATTLFSLDLQGNSIAYRLPSFTSFDGAVGIAKDAWLLQFYGQNLTDTRAELYANYWQYYKAITVNRPRTIGLRLSYKFGGG